MKILAFIISLLCASILSTPVYSQNEDGYYCNKEKFESKYKPICVLDENGSIYVQKILNFSQIDKKSLLDKTRVYLIKHNYKTNDVIRNRETNVDEVSGTLICNESVIRTAKSIMKSSFQVDYRVIVNVKDNRMRITISSEEFCYDKSPMLLFKNYYPFTSKGKDRTVRTAFSLFFDHSERILNDLYDSVISSSKDSDDW